MKKAFTLIEVLVVAVIVSILAAVAIPAYNAYIRGSKEKVAISYGGTLAAAAAAYYSQSQKAPAVNNLGIDAPTGYTAVIGPVNVVVTPAGTPVGYNLGDFAAQTVAWKDN